MDGVTPAIRSPSMFAPAGAPVQLPQLRPNVAAALDRAIQSGDPAMFMQLAGRARLNPQQAMEYLRQNVQRTGGQPSEGAQRIGAALEQRLQAEQGRQPRQAPDGQGQPGAGQQQGGGLFEGIFKAIGDFFKSIWNFFTGGNRQQAPAQAPDGPPRAQR